MLLSGLGDSVDTTAVVIGWWKAEIEYILVSDSRKNACHVFSLPSTSRILVDRTD